MTVMTVMVVDYLEIEIIVMLKDLIETIEVRELELLAEVLLSGVIHVAAYVVIALFLSKFRRKFIHTAVMRYKDYVFENILNESVSDFGDKTSAKLMRSLSTDLHSIETDYLVGALNIFSIAFIYIMTSETILHMEWRLALPIVIITLIGALFTVIFCFMDHEGRHDVEPSDDISEQTRDLLGGFTVIKTFKAEKKIMDVFRHRSVVLESDEEAGGSKTVRLYVKLTAMFVNAIVFALGFWLAFAGDITIGMVIAFIFLKGFMLEPVKELGHMLVKLRDANSRINDLAALMEKVAARKARERREGLIDIDVFSDSIELENVSVPYTPEEGALRNVSLKLEKGKSYAIVGAYNSGKTTLIKAILHHFAVYDGAIRIDGHELRDVNPDSLYDDITAIFGESIFLFDGTIEDNVTVFQSTDKEVFEGAIKAAGLEELIEARGSRYPCGECGKRLSAEERRRVAIARYLVKQTPILILDELDYDLDSNAAVSLLNTVLDIDGTTKIVVTNHLDEEVMQRFDAIIVMNRFEICELGSYDVLMEKKERFYSLQYLSRDK